MLQLRWTAMKLIIIPLGSCTCRWCYATAFVEWDEVTFSSKLRMQMMLRDCIRGVGWGDVLFEVAHADDATLPQTRVLPWRHVFSIFIFIYIYIYNIHGFTIYIWILILFYFQVYIYIWKSISLYIYIYIYYRHRHDSIYLFSMFHGRWIWHTEERSKKQKLPAAGRCSGRGGGG